MSTPPPAKMSFDVVSVRLSAQISQARCKDATISLDTDEPDRRLDLLHDNVRKFDTVVNTVAPVPN